MSTHPPEERITAWREGLLTPPEAAALKEHCRQCPRCDEIRREIDIVLRALAIDAASRPAPSRSFWPALDAPCRRWAMALASSAAALAGLIIGYAVGTWAPIEERSPSAASTLIPSQTLSDVYFEGIISEQVEDEGGEQL